MEWMIVGSQVLKSQSLITRQSAIRQYGRLS